MTELADLELWIREHIKEVEKGDDGTLTFFDGYRHAIHMVLRQIKEMRKARA